MKYYFASCPAHLRAAVDASLPKFLHACALIFSRTFSSPAGPLLLPLADLLNHSEYYNCKWEVRGRRVSVLDGMAVGG